MKFEALSKIIRRIVELETSPGKYRPQLEKLCVTLNTTAKILKRRNSFITAVLVRASAEAASGDTILHVDKALIVPQSFLIVICVQAYQTYRESYEPPQKSLIISPILA